MKIIENILLLIGMLVLITMITCIIIGCIFAVNSIIYQKIHSQHISYSIGVTNNIKK